MQPWAVNSNVGNYCLLPFYLEIPSVFLSFLPCSLDSVLVSFILVGAALACKRVVGREGLRLTPGVMNSGSESKEYVVVIHKEFEVQCRKTDCGQGSIFLYCNSILRAS